MNLTEILYHDVKESFGMGGPHLGVLEFKGQLLNGIYLADGERLSQDRSKLIFSRLVGEKKTGMFNSTRNRKFHILIYDSIEDEFYQSIKSYPCLAIEGMEGNLVIFHEAFHISSKKFRRTSKFNDDNFTRIKKRTLHTR